MKIYQTKSNKIPSTSYREVHRKAMSEFNKIKALTKRQPHIRSAYFNKNKIFFTYFWKHLNQKTPRVRLERLKLFTCGIELVKNSDCHPTSKENPAKKGEIVHRFYGKTARGIGFVVQIKESKRTGRKELMSMFISKAEV